MRNMIPQDVRFAFRMLAKSPAFTTVAVLSLALGIGANTTIFTIVNAVFLDPLPVDEAARVVNVYTTDEKLGGPNAMSPMSYLNFEDLRNQNDVVTSLAAFAALPATMMISDVPEQVITNITTANYFDVLAVRPLLGRTFLPDEDRGLGGYPVAVLSHSLWNRAFGGDPAIIGTNITLNSQPFVVVGVMPPGFKGTFSLGNPEVVWVPLSMRNQIVPPAFQAFFDERRPLMLNVFGRLRDGVMIGQAEVALKAIAARLEREYPDANEGRSVRLAALTDAAVGINQRDGMVRAGTVLMAVVGLVLLIACVNLANLLLARSATRTKEISLRVALGAGRGRIVRQLLTESVVLSVLGGLAGLLVAQWGRTLLWSFRPPFLNDNAIDLALDTRVLAFTLGVTVLTGVLFGLLPAFKASTPNLNEALKVGGRQEGQSLGRSPLRSLLVISEVALAVVTLIGAGLFVRSMQAALDVDPGFESEHLFVFAMNLASRGYSPEQGRQFFRDAVDRASGVPGVEQATISANFPLGGGFLRTVIPEGMAHDPNQRGRLSMTNIVSPSFFQTGQIPLVRGRLLNDFDRDGSRLAVVVNEAFAARYFPDEDAIGKRFYFIGQDSLIREVVGIVRNTTVNQIGEDPQSVVYIPLAQDFTSFATLQVRTAGDPRTVMGTVMREVQTLDPELALTNEATIEEILTQALWPRRMGAALLSIFGLLALGLAAVGIYGVMSYTSSQRRHEIGIRMAVGARRADILRMVLASGLTVTGVGVLVGLVGAAGVSRFASSLLFGVSAIDPVTYLVITLVLGAVAMLASYLPARRATRVDPLMALRTE